MNIYQQKAEIWETQVWLMWILALGLFETSHYVLFGIVLTWSIITAVGSLAYALKGKTIEMEKTLQDNK